jgi:hypothetical protein
MRVLVPIISIFLSYRFGHRRYNSCLPVRSSPEQLAVAFCFEQYKAELHHFVSDHRSIEIYHVVEITHVLFWTVSSRVLFHRYNACAISPHVTATTIEDAWAGYSPIT